MKGTGIRVPSSSGRTARRRFQPNSMERYCAPLRSFEFHFPYFISHGWAVPVPPAITALYNLRDCSVSPVSTQRRRLTRTGFITFSGFSIARNSMRTARKKKKKNNPSLVIILNFFLFDTDFLTVCSEFNFNFAKCFKDPSSIFCLSLEKSLVFYLG